MQSSATVLPLSLFLLLYAYNVAVFTLAFWFVDTVTEVLINKSTVCFSIKIIVGGGVVLDRIIFTGVSNIRAPSYI